MDGVTILYVKQAYTLFESIIMCISVVGMVFLGIAAFATLDESIPVSCAAFAVVLIFLIISINLPQSDTLYEATVDETVSWQELQARYEVVSARGQIVTLREREPKDEASR